MLPSDPSEGARLAACPGCTTSGGLAATATGPASKQNSLGQQLWPTLSANLGVQVLSKHGMHDPKSRHMLCLNIACEWHA